jgi:glycosyltransferase involved in cell wall biosynthesis
VKPLRLAMVAQRFWPRAGSLETRAGQLACGMADCGAELTIVTARWQAQWPAEIRYHGIPVVRLDPPPVGRWSTWRWTRALAHWIGRNADQFDLVLVWGLMHEARAVIRAALKPRDSRVPVVVVPERIGWRGDCFRQVRVTGGRGIKDACQRAAAFVANSPAARQELEAAGYRRDRIVDVPQGVPLMPPRSFATQMEARSLLAEANPALQLALQAPLVVSTSSLGADSQTAGRWEGGRSWELLLSAFSLVARQKIAARLWMAGESNGEEMIAARIEALGLTGRAGLIGVFDDVEGVLSAADVHVSAAADGSPLAIIEAMAAGAASVAIDVPVNRWLLGDALVDQEAAGLLVPPDDAEALAAAILRVLDDSELAARLGIAGQKRAELEFDAGRMVAGYLELFRRLAERQ